MAAEDNRIPSNVFTYIDISHRMRGVASTRRTLDLLLLWASSWAERGWAPHIISQRDLTSAADMAIVARNDAAARRRSCCS